MGTVKEREKTDRKFTGVLYQDSENYDCAEVLAKLGDFFDDFAWIVHDKDVEEDGSPKKAHVHWVGKKKENATTLTNVSKKGGIAKNYIEYCKSFKKAVRYLVHIDHPNKAQYSIADIDCNFDVNPFFNNVDEGKIVLSFVDKRLKGASYYQLLKDSITDGTYSELRRNYGFVQLVVNEIWDKECRNV